MDRIFTEHYAESNAKAVDSWVEQGWKWGIPVTHEEVEAARQGRWSLFLTPTKPVPEAWYPPLAGCRVLGLAAGGGQQGPILTARGARCTILDYSQKQLDTERMVARREGYEIETVRADMSKRLPFADGAFDLIFHPVANCYILDVDHLWRECFRVLRPGGVLLAGLDNGINYLFDELDGEQALHVTHGLPFNPLKDRKLYQQCLESNWGIQFSHTLTEQIGGQLKAGFILTDVYEDYNGLGKLHELRIPTFWASRAVKPE